ncbi:hypothetical protein SCYAM73S_08154 [Streptomyces cyaneofuscatus]
MPHVIPPTSWLRAVSGLTIRPAAKMPSIRRTRTSPVAVSTATSANWAPKACRSFWARAPRAAVVSERTVIPSGGMSGAPASRSRSSAAAAVMAQAQERVPMEPPAIIAGPKSLSPMRTRTRSGVVSRASAAIRVSAVRAPVPMSAAAIRTVYEPSASAVTRAVEGMAPAPKEAAAVPVPSSQRPSRRIPGRGSRSAQPNLRAPSRRQAARLWVLKGRPETGPTSGSLRRRSSTGSRPARSASSSRADSIANDPGASPGARIQVGDGTSSRTTWLAVRCASASYMTRATPALGSTNSYTVEVWLSERCSRARSLPSGSAPSLTRWVVGLR